MDMKFRKKSIIYTKVQSSLSTARIIALGFAGVILLGGFLLWLPVCSAPGEHTSFIDALFTAATSVCVTGLVTVPTAVHWSTVGKIVILCIIQLGGLGVIAVTVSAMLLLGRRITLKGRRVIQEAYNLDTMAGMGNIVRKIVVCTLGAELLGAVGYSFVFIPEFGWKKGIWQSVFTSISAFCNAGMDILGEDSLIPYVGNPLVNGVTIMLIVSGGLGFLVWWDLYRVWKEGCGRKGRQRHWYARLHLHSKLVLASTALLILGGGILFLLFEYGNPDTLGSMTWGTKIQAALFQSVTTRTAGFASVDQGMLSDSSMVLTLFLMFVGGSPMGTAGGVKTTTSAILFLAIIAYLKGKDDTEVFQRKIKEQSIRTAMVVTGLGFFCLLAGSIALSLTMKASFIDIVYEITSALGTVGLSRGITSQLPLAGKMIIIVNMYLGRIGPITLATAITIRARNRNQNVHLAEEHILIG